MGTNAVLPPQTCKEPSIIRAGDTVVWGRTFDDYPASDFTLSYVFVSATAQYLATAVASADHPDGFTVTVASATTAGWAAGRYTWQAYVRDADGNRFTVDEGQLQIFPNLETATGGIDNRDADEKMLDAIKALLAGKVLAGDAQMYEIHGRKLQRYSFAELEVLRGKYALRVRNNRVRRGERVSSRTVKVAFCG